MGSALIVCCVSEQHKKRNKNNASRKNDATRARPLTDADATRNTAARAQEQARPDHNSTSVSISLSHIKAKLEWVYVLSLKKHRLVKNNRWWYGSKQC